MADQRDGRAGDVYRPKEQKAALLAFPDAIGVQAKAWRGRGREPAHRGQAWRRLWPAADLRPGTWSEFHLPAKAGHAVQTLDKRNDRLTRQLPPLRGF